MKMFYVTYVATFEKEPESEADKKLGLIEIETKFKNLGIEEPFNILDVKNQAKEYCGVEEFKSFMVIGITEFSSREHFNKFFCHPIPDKEG